MKLFRLVGGRTLLFLVMFGFVVTMGISFQYVRRTEALSRVDLTDTTWTVAQLRLELFRFSSTLEQYIHPTSTLDRDRLIRRFDILWSRLPFFIEGPDSRRYAAVPGLQDSVRRLIATLEAVEGDLRSLEKGDFAAQAELAARLQQPFEEVSELVMGALVQFEDRGLAVNAEVDRVYLTLMLSFVGALASGTGLILLLLRETRAARRAEAHAQAATDRLRIAIESISDGFVLYDQQKRLALSNEKFVDFGSALDPRLAGPEGGRLLAALATEPSGSAEEQENRLRDGRWIRVSVRPTPDGGTVGILTEITDLKLREETLAAAKEAADEANRAKSAFLATMSHELRTPLNAIIGFSEMMEQGILGPLGNPHYEGYVHDILRSGRHLLSVINDILDLSKIEAGKLDLSREEVSLADAIGEANRIVRAQAEESGIAFRLDLEPNLPPVEIDPKMFRQVLLNLYSNAIKFTPAGGTVLTTAFTEPAGNTVIRISDTGIGIAAADLPRVIEPFVQLENHLCRRHQGTGLGLTLVQALVDLHGGVFRLESEPNVGTTAIIVLPPARARAAASPAAQAV